MLVELVEQVLDKLVLRLGLSIYEGRFPSAELYSSKCDLANYLIHGILRLYNVVLPLLLVSASNTPAFRFLL